MVSKLSFSAALSTAVAGALLLASVASAGPCPFKSQPNPTDSVVSTSPSSLTDNQLNSSKFDFNKLGIVGAGFAALFGLYAGGTVLRARLAKQQEMDVIDVAEARLWESATSTELSTFPIEVPAEVLTSMSGNEESAESESTVTR